MAYDEALADRIRAVVEDEPGLTEKKMFGGLAFLIGGHLAVGASGQGGMLLRVEPAGTAELLDPPEIERLEMRGRGMDGWLHLGTGTVDTDVDLRRWTALGVAYARSLPPK